MNNVTQISTKPQFRNAPRSTSAILEDWLNEWMKADHSKFKAIMWSVREKHEADGWESTLDIDWPANDDISEQMKHTTQKLKRWIDCAHKLDGNKWFDLIRLIASAMPSTICAGFLTELFAHTGVVAVANLRTGGTMNHLTAAGMVAKESGEAISAAVSLPANPTRQELLNAKREAVEAQDSTGLLLEAIDQQLDERFPNDAQ